MARTVEPFLVDRRGNQGVGLAAERHTRAFYHVTVSRIRPWDRRSPGFDRTRFKRAKVRHRKPAC